MSRRKTQESDSEAKPASYHDDSSSGPTPDSGLDAYDREILECLRMEGRMPNSEIARRIGVTETTVRRRLQRLQDNNILRVVPVVDPDAVGLKMAVLIGARARPSHIERTATALATLPEVRYVAVTAGPYDLIVEAFMGSREHLESFLVTSLANIEGLVSIETSTVLRVAKFAYEWEIPQLPDC